MATYTATITWTREEGEVFSDGKFHRGHEWAFDCGVTLRATSSPHVVPKYSDPGGVDPEEAFVASLSSCHMLTFLHMAARKGLVAERYEDKAEGVMARTETGRYWVKTVTLRPKITWAGTAPDAATLETLHHDAHDHCFIANSVRTDVRLEPGG